MPGFADQVKDGPVVFTLLNIAEGEGNDFRSPKSTATFPSPKSSEDTFPRRPYTTSTV